MNNIFKKVILIIILILGVTCVYIFINYSFNFIEWSKASRLWWTIWNLLGIIIILNE